MTLFLNEEFSRSDLKLNSPVVVLTFASLCSFMYAYKISINAFILYEHMFST